MGKDGESKKSNSVQYMELVPVIEMIGKMFRNYNLQGIASGMEQNRVAAIVCLKGDEKNAALTLKNMALDIKTKAAEHLLKEIYIGVGNICSRSPDISKSYQKASKILDWIIFTNDDSEANIEKYMNTSNSHYFYPVELEERLVNNLKKSDLKAV